MQIKTAHFVGYAIIKKRNQKAGKASLLPIGYNSITKLAVSEVELSLSKKSVRGSYSGFRFLGFDGGVFLRLT